MSCNNYEKSKYDSICKNCNCNKSSHFWHEIEEDQ